MGIIIFNGISSQDLHTLVQHPPEYAIPERDYTITHVPGRDGDIVVNNGSWQNVDRIYNLAIDARNDSYSTIAGNVAKWLHSASGYARLEDTYEPEYYRMAVYKEKADISNIMMKAGTFDATFNCKPQRFLKSGERLKNYINNTIVRNPTSFISKPLIAVHGTGSGSIQIGNFKIEITNITDGMMIDCETQDAYFGTQNCNLAIEVDEFIVIEPGMQLIQLLDGVTSIDIIPRWWTL